MQFTRPVRFECCHCGRHEDVPVCFHFNDDRVPRLDVFDLGIASQLEEKGLRVVNIRDGYTGDRYVICAECYSDYLKLRMQAINAQKEFLGMGNLSDGGLS